MNIVVVVVIEGDHSWVKFGGKVPFIIKTIIPTLGVGVTSPTIFDR
jgi:hypothetical protein